MAELNLMNVQAAEADIAAMQAHYEAPGMTGPLALPDPPPSVTAALQSTVRDTTPDQVASWTTRSRSQRGPSSNVSSIGHRRWQDP